VNTTGNPGGGEPGSGAEPVGDYGYSGGDGYGPGYGDPDGGGGSSYGQPGYADPGDGTGNGSGQAAGANGEGPPGGAAVFYPDGLPPRVGERFVQPALAGTLRRLAEADATGRGDRRAGIAAARERFYRGDVAALIGAFSEKWGGLLRASDLAGYRARVEPPLSTTFAGREILGQGAWTQGPVLMQALGMLATLDLKAMGHNSARYIHTVAESLKLAFADRERYYGDVATVPIGELLAPAYLGERATLIQANRALAAAPAPGARRGAGARIPIPAAADGTTHIAAIDAQGNMVALTPSGGVFRRRLSGGVVAPLKIASGCDRRCSFCAIPTFRGAFVSRTPDEVLAEAEWLASTGVRELVLVSENSTSHGKDLGDPMEQQRSRKVRRGLLPSQSQWLRHSEPAATPFEFR